MSCRRLARDGVYHLTLIDPDRVELHNVAAGIGPRIADVGQFKVDALAAALRAIHSAMEVEALPVSITSLQALDAVATADIVITTPDHDSARLAASWLAALYLKPLLDVGVGIFRENGHRVMGADMRLV
jgi:molybdopterin-synthase adenylyltransferase